MAAISDLARLKAERDEAALQMEDLSSMRSMIVLSGTEAEVDAHDARALRAQRRHERAMLAIERIRGDFETDQFPAEGLFGEPRTNGTPSRWPRLKSL